MPANWCPLLTIMREDDWPVGYLAVCFGGDETGVLQFKLMVRMENQSNLQDSRLNTGIVQNVISIEQITSVLIGLQVILYFVSAGLYFYDYHFSNTWTWRQIALCRLHTWSQCLLRTRFPAKLWFRWHARACSVFHSNSARDWTRWPWRPVAEFTVNWW